MIHTRAQMDAIGATRSNSYENWIRARAQSLATTAGHPAPLPSLEEAVAIIQSKERDSTCTEKVPLLSA